MNANYQLRDLNSGFDSPAPNDGILTFRQVTLDANGEAVIDLSHLKVHPAAKVYYWFLSDTGMFPDGQSAPGTFGTGSLPIGAGQIPVALSAAVAASGVVPAVNIPAVSKTVMVGIFIQFSDKV